MVDVPRFRELVGASNNQPTDGLRGCEDRVYPPCGATLVAVVLEGDVYTKLCARDHHGRVTSIPRMRDQHQYDQGWHGRALLLPLDHDRLVEGCRCGS